MSLKEAFHRVRPGEQPPPPPEALRTWCTQTTHGLVGGTLIGGYLGLRQARNPSIPTPVPTHTPAHRAATFFVRESILTGSRIGLFVSIFSAAALTIEHRRDTKDVYNYAAAGGATCALFGTAVGGWMAFVPAAVFGAFTAGGGAALQDWMSGFVAPDKVEEAVVEEVKGSVECVIEKYEASLAAHPLRAVRQVAPQAAVASPVEGRDGLSSAKDMSPKPNF